MTDHSASAPAPRVRRWSGPVVRVSALVVIGLILVFSGPGSAGGASADPTDPTVPTPTAPATTAGTVPETVAPTVVPTVPVTDPPETAPPSTGWTPGDGSGGQSASGWQQSATSVATGGGAGSSYESSTPSTMPPMTTTQDLLIGTPTTPAPTTTVASRDLTGSSVTRTAGSSDPKLWAVVAGLLVVSLGLGIVTMSYWRRTAPETGHGGSRGGRRSRYADLTVTSPEPR